MKNVCLLVLLVCSGFSSFGQTTIFNDNFNRSAYSGGTATYTLSTRGGVGSAPVNSNVLALTSVATAGSTWLSAPLPVSASYTATLSSNTAPITWTFNMQTNIAITGVTGTQYGQAVILAGTSATFYSLGSGYAVTMNTNGNVNLISYTGGLSGTPTSIITASTSIPALDYLSVKITYNPADNTWQLYVRDDGSSAFSDPISGGGVYTLVGSATNSTYTSASMTSFGYFYNYKASAGKVGNFDNFTITKAAACSGTPAAGTASATVTSGCASYSTVLYLPSLVPASGLTYQWYSGTDGITFGTTISGATNAIYTASVTTSLTPTYYRANVTCSGSTGTSGSVTCNANNITSPPYTENFDASTSLPCGWTAVDVNGGTTWSISATSPTNASTPNVAQYSYSSTLPGDDWLFSKGIKLNGGTTYNLSFKYGNNSSTYIEKLELKYGTTASVAGMTSSALFSNAAITTNSVLNSSGTITITPASTGQYYFGFHAFSNLNQYNLYMDDFSIVQAPPVVSALPSTLAFGGVLNGTTTTMTTTLSANYLSPTSGNLTVTAPTGYYVWNGSAFASSATVAYSGSGSTITSPTIIVQFAPSAVATYNGNLTVTGGGLSSAYNIVLTGNGAAGCSGTPSGGTVSSTVSTGCSPYNSTLTLGGGVSTSAGITYQWEVSTDNSTWSNASGSSTSSAYIASVTASAYYRCTLTCTSSGLSGSSASSLLTYNGVNPASMPFTESFENTWVSCSSTREKPNGYWSNTPLSGSNSWRREDDGVAGAGWGSLSGAYTPAGSSGSHSARFHSYGSSSTGTMDLYITFPAGSKQIKYDYINVDGTDQLKLQLSLDNGATFTDLDIPAATATSWTTKIITTSAVPTSGTTAILRWTVTGDFGSTDIGLDNISVTQLPSVLSSSPSLAFGNVTLPGSSILSSTLSATVLTPATGTLTINAPSGFTVLDPATSTYVSSYTMAYSGSGTTISTPTLSVKFTPVSAIAYSGTITITGGGISTYSIPVTGVGANPCTGSPSSGTPVATASAGCSSYSSTLSLPYLVGVTGLSYLWQSSPDNSTWSTASGTNTAATYTATVTGAIYYRCNVTCTATSSTTSSGGILLNYGAGASAATMPFTEDFETAWVSCTSTREKPNYFWINTPVTGANSWRRDDDGVAGGGWGSLSGAYSPLGSAGTFHSARFHSYGSSSVGTLDLYVTFPAGTKQIKYDYINTSGTDRLKLQISLDNGTTYNDLDVPAGTVSVWTTQTVTTTAVPSSGTTAILRWTVTGDGGSTDIGLDNISVIQMPIIVAVPTSLAFGSVNTGTTTTLTTTLTASGLTPASGTLTVTAPSGYYIWTGSSAVTSTTISYTGGGATLSPSALSIQFAPVTSGIYNANVTITGGGLATTYNIPVTGTGANACSGVPTAGAANATVISGCSPNYSTSLSLSGVTLATGLTYQWYSGTDGVTYGTTIAGATDANYTPTVSSAIYYRSTVTCPTFGSSSSAGVFCNAPGATIVASLPFTESFENNWVCGTTRNLPGFYWVSSPTSGDASWRRQDDGTSGAWTSTSGIYSPASIDGSKSARFHTYDATSGTIGNLDLYVNWPAGSKSIRYSYINTSGTDALSLKISLDNGATFTTIDGPLGTAASWTGRTVINTSVPTSGTTAILRFTATSDYGTTDIGLDSLYINQMPSVTAAPASLSFPITATGSTTTLSTSLSGIILTPATGTLTVTAPTGYYIWTGSSAVTTTTISYTGSGASFTPSSLTVQFAPTTAITYSGNVVISGGGLASSYSIAVTGVGSTPCSGAPTAGSAVASAVAGCSSSYPTILSLSGATVAAGLAYQWYSGTDGITYGTTIAGATNATYNATVSSGIYYRATVTCPSYGTATSSGVNCNTPGRIIANMPFTEGFENNWASCGATNDIPNFSWANTPASGAASWRRDDDGASAGWTGLPSTYTPTSSVGSHSARYHTAGGPTTPGNMDLYINFPAGTKQISYDYMNTGTLTTPGDIIKLQISIDNGATFTDLDVSATVTPWTNRSVTTTFTPPSGTPAILRWTSTGDGGSSDPGIDNISVTQLPSVLTAPSSLAFGLVNTGTSVTLSSAITGVALSGSTGTLSVNAPAGYTLSSGGAFSNPLTLNYTGGALSTTLTVKFSPSALIAYNGTITISGGGLSAPASITLTGTGSLPCSGTPSPGNVVATTSSSCVSFPTTLSLDATATSGYSGMSYQWKSSSDNITYSNVIGATSSTYSLNYSTQGTTYYKCEITCASSPAIQATGQPLTFTPITTFPYTENFDALTAPALPCGWTIADVNNDGAPSQWANYAATTTGSSSPNMLSYRYNSSLPADDWIFTPAIYCTAGNTYKLTFNYGNNGGTTYPESFEVKYGASNTVSGMTTSLYSNTSVTNTTLNTQSVSFLATTSGYIYYGFHCNSLVNENRLYLDDIKVEQYLPCSVPLGSPTALSCGAVTGTTTTISFTPPSPAVDSYLVVASSAATLSSAPVSGTNYPIGASVGGGIVIAKVAAGSSVSLTTSASAGLAFATTYNVFMYSYNGVYCIGTQPNYKTTSPGVTSFTTCVNPPSAPTVSGILPGQAQVNWSGGVSGTANYTVNLYTNSAGTGSPAVTWTSADATPVSYLFTGLIPGTQYYANVVANTATCGASSTLTAFYVPFGEPYFESFETISSQNNVPSGWSATANSGTYTPKYGNATSPSGPVAAYTMSPSHGLWDFVFVGKNTTYTNNTNANNWLVSPGVYLTPGTYTLGFEHRQDWASSGGAYRWNLNAYVTDANTLPATSSATPTGTTYGTYTASSLATSAASWTRVAQSFTITTSGVYYIQMDAVSNANSSLIFVDNIAICKTPSAGIASASSTAICQGTTLTLSSSPATAGYNYYSWAGPGGYVNTGVNATAAAYTANATYVNIPTAGAGIYTVTVAGDPLASPFCAATATTPSVAVYPSIASPITPSDTTICASATYTLGGGNPASATAWSVSPSGYVTVSSAGVVTSVAATGLSMPITITYNTGCSSPVSATVKTVNSLGGTYTVGVGQQFTTLSQAVALYNCATSFSGPVVFQLTDASYPNEVFPITISSNAAASAVNTLIIRPASGVSPTISGSTSFALLGINGKYVTIEGSNNPVVNSVCPVSVSTRNLSIVNTNTSTSSAVIWMSSGANNNSVRNCNISGSGAGQTLVGIGSGGATIALNSTGSSNNNISIVNNAISGVQNGIYSMGASAGTKNTGTVINQNMITSVGNNGILVGFESGINIRGNVVTGVASSTSGRDVVGINVGFANNSIAATTTSVTGNEVSDAMIENNIVGTITSSASVGAQSAVGIAVAGSAAGTANIVVGNSVYKPLSVSNGSDITAGIFLSGITSGVADNIWYNTVALTGTPGSGTNPSFALAVSGVASPIDIKNNILVNAMTNSTANSSRALGFAYSSYTSLTSNYNVLRDSSASPVFVVVGSLTAPTSSYSSIATWQSGSGSTQDMNSILAVPVFNNPTTSVPDLGLSYATANIPINNAGTVLSYTTDARCAVRDASTPDIGINEFNGSAPPPTIAYTPITATGNCPTDKTFTATITIGGAAPSALDVTNAPRVYFSKDNISWYSNAGTYVSGSTSVGGTSTWSFTITAATLGLVGNETIYYYVVAQDQSSPASVGSLPSGVSAPSVSSIVAAPVPYSFNTSISTGIYLVGSGQTFTSLQSAVTAFANTTCLSGPVVLKLTDALYNLSSTPLTISANAGSSASKTLTIMPNTGVSPTITCNTSGATISLTANAKYIIIDGANVPVANSLCPSVVATRNMTITNTNTGTSSAVIWMGAGSNNNIIRNCVVTGNAITTTLVGIGSAGATISITGTGNSNNNNRIENNYISLVQHGIYSMGASSSVKNTGTVINQNVMTVTSGIGKNGILVGNDNGVTISGNTINNMVSTASTDIVAINVGFGDNNILYSATGTYEVTNATITNNKVDNISTTASWSAVGIAVGGATTGTSTIANNMVSGVWSKATPDDIWAGIFIGGVAGSTTNIYHNSIYLANTTTGGTVPGFGLALSGASSIINIKNNVIVNNNASGSARSAVGFAYSTYSSLTSASNDLYAASGNLVGYGNLQTPAGYYTSIAAWNTASGKDAPLGYPAVTLPISTPRGSISVMPVFTSISSPVDLSLTTSNSNYLLNNTGVSVAPTVTTDISCNTRDANYPDMGVNEITVNPSGCTSTDPGTLSASTAAYCVSGSPTITLNTATTGAGAYYQWQSSATGTGSWSSINGATNITYSPTITTTTYYRALVACLNISPVEQTQATPATITIAPQPSVTGLSVTPGNTSICSGGVITLTGVTTGGAGTPTYTWSGPGIVATTGSTLISPFLTPTVTSSVSGAYSMTVSYDGVNCMTSAPFATASVFTVSPQPLVTALSLLPANLILCSGAAISLTANATGGAGTPVYTWSGPGIIATTGTGATSAVLNPTVSSLSSGAFSVTLAYSGNGCVVTTPVQTAAIYTVSTQPSILSVVPSVTSLCAGQSLTITATTVGGYGTGTYTWSGAAIATTTGTSAISPVFTPTLASANVYSVSVGYNGTGCVAAVATTTVTTNANPSASISAAMPNICQPTTSASIWLSSIVGAPSSYSVVWNAIAHSDGLFSDITGAALSGSSVTLNFNPAGGAGSFDGVLTLANGACAGPSYPIHVIVHANPAVAVSAINIPCVGYAGSIDFTGTDSATVAYSVNGGSATSFTFSGTTHNLSTGVLNTARNYLIIDAHNAVCTSAVGTTITIDPTPMAWVGGTIGHETDWNTVTNWSCGFVPTIVDDVMISAAASGFDPLIPSTFSATTKNLTLSNTGVLVIDGSGKVDVKGTFTNNNQIHGNGKVVLSGTTLQHISGIGTTNNLELNNSNGASIDTGSRLIIGNTITITSGTLTTNDSLELASTDTFSTARIAALTSSGADISGKVKVDQYVMGGYRRYRFVAHPFKDTISLGQLQNYIDITGPGGTTNGFRTTGSNAPSAFRLDPYTSNSSIGYDPGWKPFTKINSSAADSNKVHPGQGIRLFFRGAKGEGLGYGALGGGYTPSSVVFKMMGNVNQGNVSVALQQGSDTAHQSFNMIGNPYPSPVDMGKVIWRAREAGRLSGAAFYIFDPAIGAGGNFVTVGLGAPAASGGSAVSYYVQANTCIQVRAASDGALIDFTEADKSANTSNYLYKAPVDYTTLAVYDEKYHVWDRLQFDFNDKATDNEDRLHDAAKPMGIADFNFYSTSADDRKLAIDSRPFAAEKVIPLGVSSGYQQNFIIRADNIAVPAGGKLVLHDKLLGKYVELNAGTEYPFNIGKDKTTQGDRFELAMKSSTPAVVKPLTVSMTPNPATDDVKISFTSGKKEQVSVRVIDISGVSVYNKDLDEQQNGTISVPLSTFAAGIYMVELTQGNQKVTQRLVKE